MTWRPIETAPKDGTRILLGCNAEVDAGRYWRSENQRNPRERWVWNGWPKYQPTHWKPLPDPPKRRSA
jgi:hypothetical protein